VVTVPRRTPLLPVLGPSDIVPENLHRRLGWTEHHQAIAGTIVERFGLQLPRDRELVRQLAGAYVLNAFNRATPPW
jgi:hypothetical protein